MMLFFFPHLTLKLSLILFFFLRFSSRAGPYPETAALHLPVGAIFKFQKGDFLADGSVSVSPS
ncbi:hypothetical protein J4730_21930 [Klebsiella pneumoniae]|uniref:Uncharacterized protein n=1 Tax=Klebsiella pneumoniae TaxID=573 RepID=A0A939ST49_KLEPN|nr:hypothetical protein [Klebsiella pneumoniae]